MSKKLFVSAILLILIVTNTTAFEGAVEDRLAIQELCASYGDAVHRHDVERLASLWAEEARWQHPGYGTLQGRSAIIDALAQALNDFPMIHFLTMLGSLRIKQNHAIGTSYIAEVVTDNEGRTYRATGRYDDEFVKRDGRWFFVSRTYTLLHQD
jgi:uncharacterized protein (TIGR02246 family)